MVTHGYRQKKNNEHSDTVQMTSVARKAGGRFGVNASLTQSKAPSRAVARDIMKKLNLTILCREYIRFGTTGSGG